MKELNLSEKIQKLIDEKEITFVGTKTELEQKLVEIRQDSSVICRRPCDRTLSTCFVKETPTNLWGVSSAGIDPAADFSKLHCVIEPCITEATINLPNCPPQHVQTKLNAVRICGRLGYQFNFAEVFFNDCTADFDIRTAAGQGTTSVDQVLCYIQADEFDCPVDLCLSQMEVSFLEFIIYDGEYYVVYYVEFTFPACP